MATLKELSDRTGYSAATISRILTGDPSLAVTEEVRTRVALGNKPPVRTLPQKVIVPPTLVVRKSTAERNV